nr:nucleoside phosphorylase [uncultured Desulfobulbus sp.]
MGDALITPRRESKEPQLPECGIFALNPSDASTMISLAKEQQLRRQFLFNSQLFFNERFFLAGPAVGAPMAAICLEKLIALGARRIVVYGWCGSIHSGLHIGDLFMPTSGLSEEGTSAHYGGPRPWNLDFTNHVAALAQQSGLPPKSGPIWTTDALYRETRYKVERYGQEGILAVDMEYTALHAVAAFRQAQLAGVMLVSDELFAGRWRPGFGQKTFRSRSRQTLGLLVSLINKAMF